MGNTPAAAAAVTTGGSDQLILMLALALAGLGILATVLACLLQFAREWRRWQRLQRHTRRAALAVGRLTPGGGPDRLDLPLQLEKQQIS
jgi:hypothetical protein